MFLVSSALSLSPLLAPGPLPAPTVAPLNDQGGWDFSYTFLEIGAARYDVDVIDDEADVYYGRASVGFLDFLYVFGQYENQSVDFNDTSTDQITLGGGVHFDVMPNLDLFGEIGWLYNKVDSDNIGNLDDTDNGYRIGGGARWMVLPWPSGGLELNGMAGVLELDNRLGSDDDPFFWNVGARAHVLESLSVGLNYEKLEDDDQVSISARFSF